MDALPIRRVLPFSKDACAENFGNWSRSGGSQLREPVREPVHLIDGIARDELRFVLADGVERKLSVGGRGLDARETDDQARGNFVRARIFVRERWQIVAPRPLATGLHCFSNSGPAFVNEASPTRRSAFRAVPRCFRA